jgi:putative transposase
VTRKSANSTRKNLATILALEKPELSPRELAVTFTHAQGYFVSEASITACSRRMT